MWTAELPPFLPFYAAALLVLAFVGALSNAVLCWPLRYSAGMHLWLDVEPGIRVTHAVLDYELVLMRTDRLSLLFGYLFHIAAFIAVVFSLHVRDKLQQVAGMVYAGSALGAVFAGDLITLFVFWELLALSSVFLIWARRTSEPCGPAMRYLIIQVVSGVLLLAGALARCQQTGSLAFEYIGLDGLAAG